MCAVKRSYDYSVHAKRQLYSLKLLSMSDGRIGRLKQVSEIVLCGTILSVKQLLKKIGDNIFALAKDRFTN